MNAILAVSIGSALAGVALIIFDERKQDVESSKAPPIYGESVKVTLPVPDGWRRVTNAEVAAMPDLSTRAVALLNTPGFSSMTYGTLTPFVSSNGRTYATWVEQHYNVPGGAVRPWGLHHGVTILAHSGGS
jgi:hypothetical protein